MDQARSPRDETEAFDCLIVGAGFAGMYAVIRLRELGLRIRAFEAGDDVGGTWYWSRYPGAQCDVPSRDYSFSFSDELQKDWAWTRRFSPQSEILDYINHVAKRFDVRRDIRFNTRVTSAVFDEASNEWVLTTDRGDVARAPFCIMATGPLSLPSTPDFSGLGDFEGEWFHTGKWPHRPVDFKGKRVGVIGTGSSGIQIIPRVAADAHHLHVFQRTPQYSLPNGNFMRDPEDERRFRERDYKEYRRKSWDSTPGFDLDWTPIGPSAADAPDDERNEVLEMLWKKGGTAFLRSYGDLFVNKRSNDLVADFVRDKIRGKVRDPGTAALLTAMDYPIGTKRICLDEGYYETFNRDNVTLVSLKEDPIQRITTKGIRLRSGEIPLDMIVFATGYDAVTGALRAIDVRGLGGETLRQAWEAGPRSYLGMMVPSFPNLFIVSGPGSPSVFANLIYGAEYHINWYARCIQHMRRAGLSRVEPTRQVTEEWTKLVADTASQTLFPLANSWWLGANIPGKPKVFLAYLGGFNTYTKACEDIAADDYRGFVFGS